MGNNSMINHCQRAKATVAQPQNTPNQTTDT